MIEPTYQILTNLSCNLDCTYCYENKNKRVNKYEDMVEYLEFLMKNDKTGSDVFTIDYIGGESLLVVDLLDRVNQWVLKNMHKYGFKSVRFSHSTNGTLFGKKEVQDYVLRYKDGGYYGISIDGIKATHDKFRIYKDGRRGSHDVVVEGIKWMTANVDPELLNLKATYSLETFKDYAEGAIYLMGLGVKYINANLIFEDEYTKEWAATAAHELIKIVDYVYDNNLIDKIDLMHFMANGVWMNDGENYLKYNGIYKREQNWCGSCEHMICLGFDRKVYGCNRFLTMDKEDKEIGYLEDGKIRYVNYELVREVTNQFKYMPDECKQCPMQYSCASCVAIAYEEDGEIDVKKYLAQKKQCGWTLAKGIACDYARLRGEKNV